ncbi:MAG: hypothetical protein AAF938_15350 [Myxococcota bacterium]
MTAVIWFVQLVHYPLFARVGDGAFNAYEAEHVTRITWIVMPLMLAELVSAGLLVLREPSPWALSGAALVGVIWLSTALLQVPLHGALQSGFDADVHTRLVRSNWVRTFAWSLRFLLLFAPWVGGAFRPA